MVMYFAGVQDEAGNQVAAAAAVQSYGGLESSPSQPPMTPRPPDFSLRGSDAFAAAATSHHPYDRFGSASTSAAAAPGPVYFNDGQDLNSIVAAG
ncbi:unnamed protein product [Cuscuta campestris]|uniref:Uncharacterized protein n=1 Tax=Cuscuta campestris TaxID=132261 RepID=A0A484MJ25_9ASTE|nr:unnamed protein product [Cuscuta campestris]